jgi:hypothetical protein
VSYIDKWKCEMLEAATELKQVQWREDLRSPTTSCRRDSEGLSLSNCRNCLPEEVENDLVQHLLHFEEMFCEYAETYVLI